MIKITIKDIELTPSEAKEVFEDLKSLFGEKRPLPWDSPYPFTPAFPYPQPPKLDIPIVTCRWDK